MCRVMTPQRRTPSQEILRHFRWNHLPPHLQEVSSPLGVLAYDMEHLLPDGPEKTMGLRKLLEAKDCFVRAALPDEESPQPVDPPAGVGG